MALTKILSLIHLIFSMVTISILTYFLLILEIPPEDIFLIILILIGLTLYFLVISLRLMFK